jgi:hypothetical protein
MSGEWQFPRITDFWEYRTKAVLSGAEHLQSLSADDRARSLTMLAEQVRGHMRRLDDSYLVAAAWVMAEDLYKSLFGGFWWSDDVADYLAATASVLIQELMQRGFVLHYVVDNTASPADLPMMLTYVPAIYQAAGLSVVGPQLMALAVMKDKGKEHDVAAIPAYIAEGKEVADYLVTRLQQDRISYVFLNLELAEAESAGVSFNVALSNAQQPGTIVVFRQQPPVAGTTSQLFLPPGITLPQ